ncbi:MAG: nuclear transport factor 2 family protein [Bacteroidota bacterium]
MILALLFSCNNRDVSAFKDTHAIEETMQEYRAAWKSGDSEKVLEKLSSDVMLFQPGKTAKPIVGKEAVSNFWFPESDISYPITAYTVSNQEINGSSTYAYYQGVSKLTWYVLENKVARDTTTSISEFTTILKKENSTWKIHRIMYVLKDEGYAR